MSLSKIARHTCLRMGVRRGAPHCRLMWDRGRVPRAPGTARSLRRDGAPTWKRGSWARAPAVIDLYAHCVSRFVDDMRHAIRSGRLGARFRPNDVREACPGWADHTYGVFLPKHRRGNPGGYTAYFERHADGSYSML